MLWSKLYKNYGLNSTFIPHVAVAGGFYRRVDEFYASMYGFWDYWKFQGYIAQCRIKPTIYFETTILYIGKTIEFVEDVLKLYKSLQSSQSVNLKLKRCGWLKTIDYNIE